MGSKRFELNVTVRVALLALSSMLLGVLLVATEYRATTLLVAVAILVQVGGLLRTVTTTNRELSRFLTAIAHSDFSQTFGMRGLGSAFDELGSAFTTVLERFKATRADTERQAEYLNALLEHVPVALAAVWPEPRQGRRVELLNNAARRLLGPEDLARRTADGHTVEDALRELKPGDRLLLRVAAGVGGGPQQLTVAATQLTLLGEPRLLVSLQNIAGDLEATEVKAWQDLVRVLTHEMMNSLTPVSSLTRTAQAVLADLREKVEDRPDLAEEMQDAEQAIDTVARRSDGLLRFVERYRQFTSVPKPQLQRVKVRDVVDRMERLMTPAMAEKRIRFEALVLPPQLEVSADPDLLDQILINLLKNAVEALGGREDGVVKVTAHLDEGGRVLVTVADNGPGIPPEVADKIFVPFFTTKREGSGVGLSLARQIMLAHGGSIAVAPAEGGGTAFALRF
ncbi:PAS domain-containing protein [Aerophototrophica crusticola]|uniref:histidine kinase n=1 Tax=Aerophototrophica crusticola TaxID=1709002 RepID=A0A858R541_9PROT|nr:PAS domain-containing protein [Rhodospirillaceae bacterium B3]